MTYHAVTISGEVASGKSSVAKSLLALLPGWTRANTGQRFRDFCAARGWTIQQVADLPDDVHREFDADQKRMLETGCDVIVEGRLAGWLARDLPGVFRVFCVAPLEVRIRRYMQRDGVTAGQAAADIAHRDLKDVEKFSRIYGMVDYRSPAYYHLILDTTTLDPAALAALIVDKAGLRADTSQEYK